MKAETHLPFLRPDTAAPINQPDDLLGAPAVVSRHRLLEPFRQSSFGIGLLLLAISGGAFFLYDWLGDPRRAGGNNTFMIMLHYGLAMGFSIFLLTNGFLKFRRPAYADSRPARWLGLLLWLISAYALNREITVFQQSTAWLCGALVMVSAAMVGYA